MIVITRPKAYHGSHSLLVFIFLHVLLALSSSATNFVLSLAASLNTFIGPGKQVPVRTIQTVTLYKINGVNVL